jgi:hypothetical protein
MLLGNKNCCKIRSSDVVITRDSVGDTKLWEIVLACAVLESATSPSHRRLRSFGMVVDRPAAITAEGYLFLEAVIVSVLGVSCSSSSSALVFVGVFAASVVVVVVVVVVLLVIVVVDDDSCNSWHCWTITRSARAVSANFSLVQFVPSRPTGQ